MGPPCSPPQQPILKPAMRGWRGTAEQTGPARRDRRTNGAGSAGPQNQRTGSAGPQDKRSATVGRYELRRCDPCGRCGAPDGWRRQSAGHSWGRPPARPGARRCARRRPGDNRWPRAPARFVLAPVSPSTHMDERAAARRRARRCPRRRPRGRDGSHRGRACGRSSLCLLRHGGPPPRGPHLRGSRRGRDRKGSVGARPIPRRRLQGGIPSQATRRSW